MATKQATFFVRNTLARLITLGGAALVPGAVTEVRNDEAGVNKRDVEDYEGLEIVSQGDAEAESTIETRDVLHPRTDLPTIAPADANPNPKNGWQTPGGLTGDAAATSAAGVKEGQKANAAVSNVASQSTTAAPAPAPAPKK